MAKVLRLRRCTETADRHPVVGGAVAYRHASPKGQPLEGGLALSGDGGAPRHAPGDDQCPAVVLCDKLWRDILPADDSVKTWGGYAPA